MEILSECDLLDDQADSDLVAYRQLAFGRLAFGLTEDRVKQKLWYVIHKNLLNFLIYVEKFF